MADEDELAKVPDPRDAEIVALKKQLAMQERLSNAKLAVLEGQRNEALTKAVLLEAELRMKQETVQC